MRTERKAAVMIVTENIEMELFSSEESCVVIQRVKEEEKLDKYTLNQVSLNLRKCDLCGSHSPQIYRSVRMFSCVSVIYWQVLLEKVLLVNN